MNVILKYILDGIFYFGAEAVAIILVIHGLFQKKFRFDKAAFLLVLIQSITYTIYNSEELFDSFPVLAVVIRLFFLGTLFIYICFEFKTNLEKALQIIVSTNIIVFTVEVLILVVCSYPTQKYLTDNEILEAIGYYGMAALTLAVCYFIYKKLNVNAIFSYVFEKNSVLGRVIVILAVLGCVSATMVHLKGYMNRTEGILFLVFTVLLILTLSQWKKATELGQEKDKRILIQQMCQESYEQLILEVRNRQHEFQNHLTALQGMSYSCETIEELSQLQGQYCDEIMEKNKYNKLLYACKNPIIGGFLYSKFLKAEKQGIETDYQVSGNLETDKIEVFELIEILGILYDNAIDALKQEKTKKIYVGLKKEEEQLVISVENISPYISSKEMGAFFQQGFSTKGKERGLGLAKLQKIVEKNKGKIITQNVEREEENWISFTIYI